MTPTITTAARSVLAAATFLASFAPALAVTNGAIRGGAGASLHTDILTVSVLLAAAHAFSIWHRLRRPTPTAVAAQRWIATTYDIVLTAVGASLAAGPFLYYQAESAADFANSYPMVILWAMLQLAGIAVGELAWLACARSLRPAAHGD